MLSAGPETSRLTNSPSPKRELVAGHRLPVTPEQRRRSWTARSSPSFSRASAVNRRTWLSARPVSHADREGARNDLEVHRAAVAGGDLVEAVAAVGEHAREDVQPARRALRVRASRGSRRAGEALDQRDQVRAVALERRRRRAGRSARTRVPAAFSTTVESQSGRKLQRSASAWSPRRRSTDAGCTDCVRIRHSPASIQSRRSPRAAPAPAVRRSRSRSPAPAPSAPAGARCSPRARSACTGSVAAGAIASRRAALELLSPRLRDWFERSFAGAHRGAGAGLARDRRGRARAAVGADRLGQDARRVPVGAGPPHSRGPAARGDGTRVLYISPLKALAYDIERNLRAPLRGIGADGRHGRHPHRRHAPARARRDGPQAARHPDHDPRVRLSDPHLAGADDARRRRGGDRR